MQEGDSYQSGRQVYEIIDKRGEFIMGSIQEVFCWIWLFSDGCGVYQKWTDLEVDSLAKTFEKEGGFSERLYQARKKYRDKKF